MSTFEHTHKHIHVYTNKQTNIHTYKHKFCAILKHTLLVYKILNEGVSTVNIICLCKNWSSCNKNSFTDKHINPNLDGKTEHARYRGRSFYHSATWPLTLKEEHRLRVTLVNDQRDNNNYFIL